MDELSGYLAANPLKEGISKEELKTRIPRRSDQRFFAPLLAELEKEGKLVAERELVSPVGVRKQAASSSSGLGAGIARLLAERGIEPPTIKELAEALRSTEKEVRDHLALLTREGGVTRVSGDIFYDSARLKTIEEKLIAHLRVKAEIIPSEFRELTGLSRKFMIPLLEYFDSRKVTIRIGDKRVLRGR